MFLEIDSPWKMHLMSSSTSVHLCLITFVKDFLKILRFFCFFCGDEWRELGKYINFTNTDNTDSYLNDCHCS